MKTLIVVCVVLVSSVSAAFAQGLPNYSVTPATIFGGAAVVSSSFTPNAATDYVSLGRGIQFNGVAGVATPVFLPLSAFAMSASTNARIDQVNARIDQAFQQITQAERGVAAVAAMANISMPSMPGRTTWAINGSIFGSEIGGGFSFAHRLPTTMPLAVTAAYGNGGGTAHIGRVGLMGEF